ncbi:MAG: disulfide oxidoreductase [Fusobacteriia bacterium 4572_132]|nr:MAG: disulfide oxidoreductase [Fusobacteriia bacterium 4572_132]
MKVTKDMNILAAVQEYPEIAQVFSKYGLGCIGCMVASGESLGEGITSHGLNADIIIEEINTMLEK